MPKQRFVPGQPVPVGTMSPRVAAQVQAQSGFDPQSVYERGGPDWPNGAVPTGFPGPQPGAYTGENRGHWIGGPYYLRTWTAAEEGESWVASTLWSSPRPAFDMRPDLGNIAGKETDLGQPIMRGGAYGNGASLMVLLQWSSPLPQLQTNVVVESREYVHPYDPSRMVLCSQPEDLTSDVYDGGDDGCLLVFSPPAYPVRYWRVELLLYQYGGEVGDLTDTFKVEAAVY